MTKNQNQASTHFLLIAIATLALLLLSTQLIVLGGLVLALAIMLYASRALAHKGYRYLVLHIFILLGVLPLFVERVDSPSTFSFISLGWGWGITPHSIELGLRVYLRAVGASSVMYLLLHYIPIYRLCQMLRSWHVPSLLVELIELSYRYIHLSLEQAERIYEAQCLRLGYQSWTKRWQHSSLLFAQSFSIAHSEAEHMYDGLLSRQFDELQHKHKADEGQTNQGKDRELSHSPRSPYISVEYLCYRYKEHDTDVLHSISLDIHRGERIALLGANGAGKSTLMHILSGLKRERSGIFTLDGQVLKRSGKSLRSQRQSVALVMQNANHQLFCPSVEDEIAFGLRNAGYQEEEVQASLEAIIAEFELEPLRYKAPHELSEGQKKWLSIASVMALRPKVLLMDEPTACLDCYYTEQVLALVDKFCASGGTVILSTHDMNLAYAWAERAVVMSAGTIAYDADVESLFADEALLTKCKLRQPYGFTSPRHRDLAHTLTDTSEYALGLYHDVHRLQTLVYGAGKGAMRKVQTLITAGIEVYVVAPEMEPEMMQLLQASDKAKYICGAYPTDTAQMAECQLIVAGTGQVEIDRAICHEALEAGKLVANLSDPQMGNIQFAAQLNKAGLHIAVHSSHRLPELTQYIRDLIDRSIDTKLGDALGHLSQLRQSQQQDAYNTAKQELIAQIHYDWTYQHQPPHSRD